MPVGPARRVPTTGFNSGEIAKSLAGWTDLGDSGSGMAQLDLAGGGIVITMDGTDNDCETIEWMGESVDPTTTGTRFGFNARIWTNEADETNWDMDWFIGFTDTATSSFWADGDTIVSGVHVGFAKYTNSLFFRRIVQQATTNSGDTSATTTAVVDETTYDLRCECVVGTRGISAEFWVDDTKIGDTIVIATTGYGLMAPAVSISTNGTNAEVFRLTSFNYWSLP